MRFGAQEEASCGQRPQASLSYAVHARISPSQNTCWELLVWGIRLMDGTELPEPVSLQRDQLLLILLQDVVQLLLPSEVPWSSSASTSLSIIRIIKIYSRSPQELRDCMSLLFCLHKTVVAESWEASTRFSGSAFSSEVQARDVSSPEPPSRSAAETALEFTSQASWGKAHSSSSEVSRPLSNRPERTTHNLCLALSSLISCQHLATRSVRSKDMGRSGDTTGSVLWAT